MTLFLHDQAENCAQLSSLLHGLFDSGEIRYGDIGIETYTYTKTAGSGTDPVANATVEAHVNIRQAMQVDPEMLDYWGGTGHPLHLKGLNAYYRSIREGRNFADAKVKWLKRVEDSLPLDRIRIVRIVHLPTGRTLGLIRIFNGSAKRTFHVPVTHAGKEVTFIERRMEDANHALPLERAIREKGAQTTLIEEFRSLYPDIEVNELGKAWRMKNEYGEVAQAFWELETASKLGLEVSREGKSYFFAHTDRAGAIVYSRKYSAKILEKIEPPKKPGGPVSIRRQTKIEPDDSPEADYVLGGWQADWYEAVLKSFETDPKKKLLLEHIPRVKSMFDQTRRFATEARKNTPTNRNYFNR